MTWLTATADLQAQWKKAEADRYGKKQFVSTLKHALDTWRVNSAALEDLGMLSVKLGYLLGPGVEVDDARFAGEVLNGPDSLTGGDIP